MCKMFVENDTNTMNVFIKVCMLVFTYIWLQKYFRNQYHNSTKTKKIILFVCSSAQLKINLDA